jgi:galactokinase
MENNKNMFSSLNRKFFEKFNQQPINIISPGRINLAGEHTDYNNGFVLPATINKSMYFAMAISPDSICRLYAEDLGEQVEIDLSKPIQKSNMSWVNYLLGSIDELKNTSHELKAVNCIFKSEIPIGAGMSSSAALECGFIYGLNELFNLNLSKMQMATIGQKVENNYIGLNSGIMDQFTCLHGKSDSFIKLDCQSMSFQYFPYRRKDVSIVLCDSTVSHNLAESEYNLRYKECAEIVSFYQQFFPEIKSLRDLSYDDFNQYEHQLTPKLRKRGNHVFADNLRVYAIAEMLFIDNLEVAGGILNKSHESLSQDYEVSCVELDFLVKQTEKIKGVLGSRMMGGGFGGCTINLVKNSYLNDFQVFMKRSYKQTFDKDLPIYIVELTDGVRLA